MSATLFDLEHKCAGPWCRFCETTTGVEAKALATEATVSDPEWVMRAVDYLNQLGPHRRFTADDLTAAILVIRWARSLGAGLQVKALSQWVTPRQSGPAIMAGCLESGSHYEP